MTMTETATTSTPAPVPTWLTPEQMGRRVRLHPKTLLRLARDGRIPCLRAGKAVRFAAEQVEAALTKNAANG